MYRCRATWWRCNCFQLFVGCMGITYFLLYGVMCLLYFLFPLLCQSFVMAIASLCSKLVMKQVVSSADFV